MQPGCPTCRSQHLELSGWIRFLFLLPAAASSEFCGRVQGQGFEERLGEISPVTQRTRSVLPGLAVAPQAIDQEWPDRGSLVHASPNFRRSALRICSATTSATT